MASALTLPLGVARLFATRGVAAGFGDLTADNRRILAMEWIVEGVALALVSLAALVAVVTAVDAAATASSAVYAVLIATLVAMALVSRFTGFRVAFLPFRLCPVIFGLSAALIVWGAWL